MNMQIPLMDLSESETKPNVSRYRLYASLLIIPYIWSLPLLSDIGFAEKDATSISGFIANAHATGAFAALSFNPLIVISYSFFLSSNELIFCFNESPGISKNLSYSQENWFLVKAWLCWFDGPTPSWETLATSGRRETAMRHLPPSVQTARGTARVLFRA